MKILITGGTGFVGGHLKAFLQSHHEVLISSRNQKGPDTIKLNLLNQSETENVLAQYSFDKIFHLASQSSVHLSHKTPFATIFENIQSTHNLLRATKRLKKTPHIIIAGTGEIYKLQNTPLTENDLLDPRNPYATSKLISDQMISQSEIFNYAHVNCLRLFNHTGPGQSETFVLGSFSKQIAAIKKGLQKPTLKVGNLEATRDFIDVRDVCRAYELVSHSTQKGQVYNICSGRPYVIKDLLNQLIKIAGVNIEIENDAHRMRPSDVPFFVGDNKKFSEAFSWQPQIKIEQTLSDMLEWWLKKL